MADFKMEDKDVFSSQVFHKRLLREKPRNAIPGFCVAELTCEACGKVPASNGDILCADCARVYAVLVDLLREHPELAKEDMARLRELFDWRNRKEQEWLNKIFRGPAAKEKTLFQTTK